MLPWRSLPSLSLPVLRAARLVRISSVLYFFSLSNATGGIFPSVVEMFCRCFESTAELFPSADRTVPLAVLMLLYFCALGITWCVSGFVSYLVIRLRICNERRYSSLIFLVFMEDTLNGTLSTVTSNGFACVSFHALFRFIAFVFDSIGPSAGGKLCWTPSVFTRYCEPHRLLPPVARICGC
jgi:hypothetical protein